jgi:hypothetical protein
MPATRDALARESIWLDERTLDFRVSVGRSRSVTISRKQAGFTDSPLAGWVSVWEHLTGQVDIAMKDRGLYPAGPATVEWREAPTGGIRLDFIIRMVPDGGLSGAWQIIMQFARVAEELQKRVAARDRDLARMPAAPAKLPAHIEELRQFLIVLARKATTPDDALIAYMDLRNHVDSAGAHWPGAHARGIGKALDQIAAFEHDKGRPMLAALVVRAGRGRRRPAGGWATGVRALGVEIPEGGEAAFWREQVEAVIAYWQHAGDD